MNAAAIFDTHAHLDDERYSGELDAVLARAREKGIAGIVTVGTDIASSERAIEIARANRGVYAAVGIHPHDSNTYNDEAERSLRRLAGEEGVVALGEIGLDYFKNYQPPNVQRRAFERQVGLAAASDLPVIVHDREADQDCLGVLERHRDSVRGVAHCFSGGQETARRFLELGFYISFAGNVTYRGAEELRRTAAAVPADRLLLETDSPYLAPQVVRGRRNEPAYLPATLSLLAELRRVSPDELAETTTRNAKALFSLR